MMDQNEFSIDLSVNFRVDSHDDEAQCKVNVEFVVVAANQLQALTTTMNLNDCDYVILISNVIVIWCG